jgi:hypothetical protein
MKTCSSTHALAQLDHATPQRNRYGKNGFAVLGVFVILTLMVVFVSSNTVVLNQLHREIRLVEQRQLKKFEPSSAQSQPQTNATTATSSIKPE